MNKIVFVRMIILTLLLEAPSIYAQSWTNLGSGMNNEVDALVCDANGNLYAGGGFTNAGGVAANRIAKWNGLSWTNLGSGIDYWPSEINDLACDTNGNLYAGGRFTNIGGMAVNHIAKWNGSSWANLGSGMNANPQISSTKTCC